MEILILTNKFPYPLKDGGAIASFNMIKGLLHCGNNITLLTFNTKKHYFESEKLPENEISEINIHSVYANTDIKAIDVLKNLLFSSKPYILERFSDKNFLSKLTYLLKNFHFDIIQIEGLYLLQYIPKIKAYTKALISYRAHNIEYEIWQNLSKNKKNPLFRFYLKNLFKRIKKYEQSIINQYDVLIPISKKDELFFQNHGNKQPSFVCPVGFDKQLFKNTAINISKKLYFIGSLEWLPNQEAVLWFIDNCWSDLKKLHPDLIFYVAGRNAPANFIKKLKHKDIIFAGEIENAFDFISDKSIMLVPLLSGSGMRVKIIEAFFMNKAVVATQLAAEGSGGTDQKHLLIAHTADEFVAQINLLLNNPNLYEQIVKNARLLAENNFENIEIAQKLHNFYKKQIGKLS